ncbi:hypothetical protein DFAR_3920020 [Desulfarculales bacterium]
MALFIFNGEMTFFAHAMRNALDLRELGYKVSLVAGRRPHQTGSPVRRGLRGPVRQGT